jgi:hypothetical protein
VPPSVQHYFPIKSDPSRSLMLRCNVSLAHILGVHTRRQGQGGADELRSLRASHARQFTVVSWFDRSLGVLVKETVMGKPTVIVIGADKGALARRRSRARC